MSALSPEEIQEIIERVHRRLGEAGEHPGAGLRAQDELSAAAGAELGDGIFPSIGDAVRAAATASAEYRRVGLEGRKAIVASIRAAMLEHAERLAEMAVAETGLGRVTDKIVKNRLVIAKTPGPEDLELEAVTGDEGMMVTEFAPFGVVAAITPTTNPTSTIINNTIAVVSAGQRARVQRASEREAGVRGEHPADQSRRSWPPAGPRTSSPPRPSRPSRAPRS